MGTDSGQSDLVVVPSSLDGERVDRAISTVTGMSRRIASSLVAAGGVTVDGRQVRQRSRKVRTGERLAVADDVLADVLSESGELPPGPGSGVGTKTGAEQGSGPEEIAFTVVHSDDQVIIVDKPPNLVVHHGAGHRGGTLADGLLARFPDLESLVDGDVSERGRAGIVHRLDKGTSGLMVVARTPEAVRSLTEQLRTRTAGRVYIALVAGDVVHEKGVVDAPVGRSARVATRMAVTPRGKPARTAYRVIERFEGSPSSTLVEATLETGRTHQVRVHMASIGHPVGGDDRYGEKSRTMPIMSGTDTRIEPGRLFLHAHKLTIEHPEGGNMSWTSPLPPDLESVLEARRRADQAAR
jgi:23S rRNA pseudouridine1911/1915/1917 synthase